MHKRRNLPLQRRTVCVHRKGLNSKKLDAKYAPADLQKIVDDLPQLDKEQQEKLLKLLQSHGHLFDSTLGKWKGSPYKVELRDGVTPYHARPYAIP